MPTHQIAEVLDARGGVHLFGDDQRLRIKIERHRGVRARSGSDRLHFPVRRLDSAYGIDHGLQMFRGRSAAAAHDANAVVLDEVLVIGCEFLRCQLVNSAATFVLGKPGVRQNRNFLGGVCPQEPDRIVHFRGAGSAIQTDDVDIERFEGSESSADFRAQKHGTGGFQCYLNGDWKAFP